MRRSPLSLRGLTRADPQPGPMAHQGWPMVTVRSHQRVTVFRTGVLRLGLPRQSRARLSDSSRFAFLRGCSRRLVLFRQRPPDELPGAVGVSRADLDDVLRAVTSLCLLTENGVPQRCLALCGAARDVSDDGGEQPARFGSRQALHPPMMAPVCPGQQTGSSRPVSTSYRKPPTTVDGPMSG